MALRIALVLLLCAPLIIAQDKAAPGKEQPADNGPCAPGAGPGRSTVFDPCKYLPLGKGITPPRALSTPVPDYPSYPKKAKKNRITGTVVVVIAVNASGGVDAVKVVRSLDPELDDNTVKAVKQYKFSPATKDGVPVPVQFQVETSYELH